MLHFVRHRLRTLYMTHYVSGQIHGSCRMQADQQRTIAQMIGQRHLLHQHFLAVSPERRIGGIAIDVVGDFRNDSLMPFVGLQHEIRTTEDGVPLLEALVIEAASVLRIDDRRDDGIVAVGLQRIDSRAQIADDGRIEADKVARHAFRVWRDEPRC